jgi:hypothetical protein
MFMRDINQQQALSFMISQTTYIEPTVYRIRYPDLNYAELVPVDSSPNEWAKSVTFFSIDQVGAADWFNAASSDVPLADFTRGKFEVGIEMAAIGYRYNLEELGQAMMLPNTNLTTERASAARRAYEEFVYNVCLFGDSRKNWLGITNHSLPSVIVASHTWAYYAANADVPLILQDFNMLLTNIWQATLTVEMADTVLLPLSVLTLLATTQLPNTTMTVLQFIQANNLYTLQTGRPLTIRAVRGLDTAGAAGVSRIIAYRRDPEIVKVYLPMPHRFYPVWQRGPFVFDVPGIFRISGLEIRKPGAFRFFDGA